MRSASKGFPDDEMSGILSNDTMYNFSNEFNLIGKESILHAPECLLKKTQYEIIHKFIQLIFITLLSFERPLTSQNAKFVFPDNQQYIAKPRFIELILDELRYCLFAVSLDIFGRSFSNFNYLSDRLYVPKKQRM